MSFANASAQQYKFSPQVVPGLSLWLDGADASSVTLNSGFVTSWRDKSGNGYTTTQTTAAHQPSYSSNFITFGTNSNYYMNMPQSAINNATTWTMFYVFNPSSPTNWIMSKQYDGSNSYNIVSMTYSTNSIGFTLVGTTGVPYIHMFNAAPYFSGTSALSLTTQIISTVYDGTTLYYYVNGTLFTQTAGSFAFPDVTNATNFTLGARVVAGSLETPNVTNFKLGELIFYNNSLSTTQRQQVEGYLAWKWGLQTSLPSSNPYYSTSSPTITTPLAYSGCTLWLDASDTTTYNTANISAWTNKGTSGGSATKGGATPTATTINGVPAIQQSGAFWSIPVNYTTGIVTVFGVATFGASTTNAIFIGSSSGSNGNLQMFGFWGTIGSRTQMNAAGAPICGAGEFATIPLFNSSSILCILGNSTSAGNGVYINGAVVTPSVAFANTCSTGTVTSYIGYDASVGSAGSLTFGEIIIYNGALTSTQRSSVESYLSKKWRIALGTTTIIGNPPYVRTFLPTDITSPRCLAWWDCADWSKIQGTVANVTGLLDKSGNGNTMTTQAGATITATNYNGKPTLNFPTAVAWMVTSTYFTLTAGVTTFFLVCQNPTTYSAGGLTMAVAAPDATNGAFFTGDYSIRFFSPNQINANIADIGTGTYNVNGVTSTTCQSGLNIITCQSALNQTSRLSFSSTFNAGSGVRNFIGSICELIIYNGVPTTQQRQPIEAYLAWKWGIPGYLPTTAPGYKLPSWNAIFNTNFGLLLWMDGSDTSTMTFSGSNVLTWTDKSTNKIVATASGGTVPYVSGGGVTFTSGPVMTLTQTITANCTMFLVATGVNAQVYPGGRAAWQYTSPWGNVTVINDDNAGGGNTIVLGAYSNYIGFLRVATSISGKWIMAISQQPNTSGSSYAYYNGVLKQTYAFTTSASSVLSAIGGGVGITPWNGNIYEIRMYNYALGTTDVVSITNELAQKWGVII
jgi:hypothetical protein